MPNDNNEEQRRPSPPSMERSRGQLASAYSPGAFFTFEGGLGSCIAIPDRDSSYLEAHLPGPVQDQILGRLNEAVGSWFSRASSCRKTDTKHPISPELCVDPTLLNDTHTGVQPIDRGRFIFIDPIFMGYAPTPLTFVCNACNLFRQFKDIHDFERRKFLLSSNICRAGEGRNCQWRQLDVIFVHWSGHWEPVMPGKYDWDNDKHQIRDPINRCPQCHSEDFFINTSAPNIGNWYFKCANPNCGFIDDDNWLKNDPETIKVLREEFPRRISEARMEPVSYRASSAYYPQSEQFILFSAQQGDLISLLDSSKSSQLADFIAERFGFGRARPSIEEIERELKERGFGGKWEEYAEQKEILKIARQLMNNLENSGNNVNEYRKVVAQLEANLKKMEDGWFSGPSPIICERNELSDSVNNLLHNREIFSSRYDPFRLVIEHEALKQTKLNASAGNSGRRPFVRFDALDKDLAPKDDEERIRQEETTRKLLNQLGMETMGLIREFDLCRFTYGFSRVQPVPYFEKRKEMMPVRLNLFPTVQPKGGPKHPIYVITQANESIYLQLDQNAVYSWLQKLKPSDMFDWKAEGHQPLGARLLEFARPFGRYLEAILARGESSAYYYVYTLLHSFSHILMKGIAEHSGLDLGSLGEYLFPADLALVVFRNGTTMDLGNLSSLWRNENERFLRHLLDPKTLICNSGSLCDANPKNPGACPDCILVPETSCIAMNHLLSRSVLRGGNAPREDGDHQEKIPGYLQVVNHVD